MDLIKKKKISNNNNDDKEREKVPSMKTLM